MFTGIIQAVGRIASMESRGGDRRLHIETADLPMTDTAIGDSIAVSGVCLTAIELSGAGFKADVSGETLACTVIGDLKAGDPVNLEKALTLATPLGGHLVSGHVDGVGEIKKRWSDGRSERFEIEAPAELARYIAAKGSICVDGISLTVNRVEGATFELNIVPHTVQATTMGGYRPGRRVNLEVDIIARYLERLLLGNTDNENAGGGITRDLLAKHGFNKDS